MPGVRGVEPIQHRFAYVGADLQDLYGVGPPRSSPPPRCRTPTSRAARARQLMATLAARPDRVLVSAETVHDFQLSRRPDHPAAPGRRAPSSTRRRRSTTSASPRSSRPRRRTASSWPTPTTSPTHRQRRRRRVPGRHRRPRHRRASPTRLRSQLGTAATVTDIATRARGSSGSSLTAVDLAGLTRVELGFALVLAAAAAGLVLGLGLAERRRTFAIATALGATGRQLGGVVCRGGRVVDRRARRAAPPPGGLSLNARQGPDRRVRPTAGVSHRSRGPT